MNWSCFCKLQKVFKTCRQSVWWVKEDENRLQSLMTSQTETWFKHQPDPESRFAVHGSASRVSEMSSKASSIHSAGVGRAVDKAGLLASSWGRKKHDMEMSKLNSELKWKILPILRPKSSAQRGADPAAAVQDQLGWHNQIPANPSKSQQIPVAPASEWSKRTRSPTSEWTEPVGLRQSCPAASNLKLLVWADCSSVRFSLRRCVGTPPSRRKSLYSITKEQT